MGENCTGCPPRPSFWQLAEDAARQIGRDDYFSDNQEQIAMADAVTRVMAEVYMLDPRVEIEIEGVRVTAAQVQEVYQHLDADVVRSVIERTRRIPREMIRNVKKYLRVALYNAVLCGDAMDVLDVDVWERTVWMND